jgi:hypothetical protein
VQLYPELWCQQPKLTPLLNANFLKNMKTKFQYRTNHIQQGLWKLSLCLWMLYFVPFSAQASVMDTLPPRDVFHFKNNVGYIDPSIDQFETAAIELSNSISAIFGVSGLKVYAYAMYPKSHPAGKSLSFSTLWQKELSLIEEEVIALNKPALRSTTNENYYLYIAWQLDASGKIAEARVRCKLPTAPESECGASESLLVLEENISQTFYSTFVSTYSSTLTPGKAGATAIEAINNMVKGMEESSFEALEGPPLPDSCEQVCYPAGSVFITPSRQLIRIEEAICPIFNWGEVSIFPKGCLVNFTTASNVKYTAIIINYTPKEIKSLGPLAKGCRETFWAYVRSDELEQYRDSDRKLTKWGEHKTVALKKNALKLANAEFTNYATTGAGAVTIKGLENGVFVSYTFNVDLPSSMDLEGPYSGGSLIIPPGTSPLCTFCDKNSPGVHYYDKAKKAGMTPEQLLLLCKNARALNELSKKWNIRLDKKVDIDYWVNTMQEYYQTPRGLYENDTPEERLKKIYQFIIYYKENVDFFKHAGEENLKNLSRIYINPDLIKVLTCQDRLDLIKIATSEGFRKLKGSYSFAFHELEDVVLKLLTEVEVDKKCFFEALIADKETFCVLMQGFIDNGVKSYMFGDGNHKIFIELLLKLYFEVLNSYDQAALRALVRTDQIIQVGASPYVNKSSRCSSIYLDAKFNCNGNIVSGTNIISLAETALPTVGAVNEVHATNCNWNSSPFSFSAFDLVMVYNYGGNYPILNSLPKNIPVPAFILPYLAQVNQNENAGEAIQFVSIVIGAISTAGAVAAAIEAATTEAIIIAALEAGATLGDVVSANRAEIVSLFNDEKRGLAFLSKLDNVFMLISVASMRSSFDVNNARTAVNALEEELVAANKLSPIYSRLREAINSLRTALKLVGISSDAEFIIRAKAAFVAVGKSLSESDAKKLVDDFKKLITPRNVLSLPHLNNDFLQIYANASSTVQDFLKRTVADWDDPVSFAKFVEDIKVKPSLLDDMAGNGGMLNAWKALSDRPDWVRLNSNLLSRLADKDAAYLMQVNDLYDPRKFQLPASFRPPGTYQGIQYNEFGFPDLTQHALNRSYYYPSANGNYTTDFRNATDWLKQQPGIESIIELGDPPRGSPLLVKLVNGKYVKYTWHHHEDGRTLMPVISEVHDMLLGKHTGGVATAGRALQGLFSSP